MKNIVFIFIMPILLLGLIIYCIGTVNIYLGSNSAYFHSAFEETHSVWECEKYNLKATVLEHSVCEMVRIEDCNTGDVYILYALGDFRGELYKIPKDAAIPEDFRELHEMLGDELYAARVVHKHWFETIYEFDVLGVDEDCWYEIGTSVIRFRRVKN